VYVFSVCPLSGSPLTGVAVVIDSPGLGLPVSRSSLLMDLDLPNRVNGFGFPFFVLLLSYSAFDATE
jgi:hypothetical protein